MDIDRIVAELEHERERINQAIGLLKGVRSSGKSRNVAAANGRTGTRRRRGMSAAARKRISEMMKKRWAERRKKAKTA